MTNPDSSSASGGEKHLPRGPGYRDAAMPPASEEGLRGGGETEHLLQSVAGTSDLLKGCIAAREALGAAKTRILRAREESREAARRRRAGGMEHAVTASLDGSVDYGSYGGGVDGLDDETRGELGREEAAALEAALPLSREFADKMAELATVAPRLSKSLVDLTAGTTGNPGANDGTIAPVSGEGEGASVLHPRSGDAFEFVQELTRVAPPALARLLSFEHLRASESSALDLVQALVNLYVWVGSGPGSASSRVSRGDTAVPPSSASPASGPCGSTPAVSAGASACPSSAGSRADMSGSRASARGTANEASNAGGSGGGSDGSSRVGTGDGSNTSCESTMSKSQAKHREKLGKKTASWVVSIIKQAVAPKVYGGKLARIRKLDELLGKAGVGAAQITTDVQNELLKNAEVLQGLAADDIESRRRSNQLHSRLRGVDCYGRSDISGTGNMCGNDAGGNRQQSGRKRPRPTSAAAAAESEAQLALGVNPLLSAGNSDSSHRFDSKAGCRFDPGGGERIDRGTTRLFSDSVGTEAFVEGVGGGQAATARTEPSEVLLENTMEAFCSMLWTRGNEDNQLPTQILRARLRRDAYRLFAAPKFGAESSVPAAAATASGVGVTASPRRRQCLVSSSASSFGSPLLSTTPPPAPPPAEWEARFRGCLSALRRRPLLCPDALLRETGAAPGLSSEACVRAALAGDGGGGEDDDGGTRVEASGITSLSSGRRRFQLPEACLLVGLNVVEEAVLEGGGGEAAAGLLRAFRTVRNKRGARGAGSDSNDTGQALAGGGRGHAPGGEVYPFVEILEQVPSGCVKKPLDELMRALDDLGQKFGRNLVSNQPREDLVSLVDSPLRCPLARPFHTELWLLVLGYRHWVLVAMVQLVSTDACPSCAADDTDEGQRKASAVRFLAWYASGGYTKASRAEAAKAEADVRRMAAYLDDCNALDKGDAMTPPPTAEEPAPSADAETTKTGDECSESSAPPVPAGVRVTEALEKAGKAGQGLMGAVFSPFLAVAWLLTSRTALGNCERVLRCSVLREEDLDGAFRRVPSAAVGSSTTSWEEKEDLERSSCVEGLLQGLAALEDMAWLCGLSPSIPIPHVHRGQDLKTLLERTSACVSALGRRPQEGGHDRGSKSRVNDTCGDAGGPALLSDFAARTAMISLNLSRITDSVQV